MTLSHEEYAIVHFGTGFSTTTPLTRLKNIGNDNLDVESLVDMGSLVFTST